METHELIGLSRKMLSALGRALTDVALYKKGHPTPEQSLRDFAGMITNLQNGGDLTIFRDGGLFGVNGHPIVKEVDAPQTVRTFFDRLKVRSLTFRPGFEPIEAEVLHELVNLKPDDAFDLQKFLGEKGAPHLDVNKATYALIEENEVVTEEEDLGAGGEDKENKGEEAVWEEALRNLSVEETIRHLVRKSVKDSHAQDKVFETVMSHWRRDLERRVQEATKLLQDEKKLVEGERKRTESVIDQIAEGTVTVDGEGKILMMDSGAEELAGHAMKDLAGKALGDAVRRDDQILSLSKDLRLSVGQDATGNVAVTGDDKLAKDLRSSNILVRDQGGRVVGFMMTLPAAAKFRELERMQQEFVASITHELRAPLTSIISALSILEGQLASALSKDQERVLGLASKNANRLVDLVAEILDFQRIQSGHMTVHPATAQVEHFVSESTDGLKPWAQTRGVDLTFEVAPGLPPVLADHRRTVQVLTNLISNAIKFTPSGGKIWVHAKRGHADMQGFVVFSVKDSGRGIAKEDQDKIFEKFVQIAASGRRFPGTGLGLPIAKYLVYLQKGKMWVESELGKGATFLFTLPMDIPPLAVSTTTGKVTGAVTPPAPEEKKPWWKFW
jgi:signal transduction histidine kinase